LVGLRGKGRRRRRRDRKLKTDTWSEEGRVAEGPKVAAERAGAGNVRERMGKEPVGPMMAFQRHHQLDG
jgi:hypothetical protein